MCACVVYVWYVRALRARRGFSWLTINSRRCSTFRGRKRTKGQARNVRRELCEKFFLYITIHIHSYTYMFINRIIDWELFLSALLLGSLSTPRSACLYINIHIHTCVCIAANWPCKRDKWCVCVWRSTRDGGWKGKRERTNNNRAEPMRVRFLRLKSCRHTKNEIQRVKHNKNR